MPQATAWPFVLALGIALLGVGFVTSPVLLIVGLVFFVFGLGGWIRQLLPGFGHIHEPRVEPALRPRPIAEKPGSVSQLLPGMAGYRFQLPLKVHPISAGVKGGIAGGLVMPFPALAYGLLSGHGLWFPVNLLAGIVVPGISGATEAQLENFHLGALILAIFIHAALSVTFGLLFGVISPTLPPLPGGPVIAGGVLMPLLWTGFCYGFMGIINPLLQDSHPKGSCSTGGQRSDYAFDFSGVRPEGSALNVFARPTILPRKTEHPPTRCSDDAAHLLNRRMRPPWKTKAC